MTKDPDPNEGAQVSQTKANQDTIAQLEARKLILRAGVEERKRPATGTHQKTDTQVLAEGLIADTNEVEEIRHFQPHISQGPGLVS